MFLHHFGRVRATAGRHKTTDLLVIFGLLAVTTILVFYALEDRSPWYTRAFAGTCAAASVYAFVQGAWAFGIVEAVWAAVALLRWRRKVTSV